MSQRDRFVQGMLSRVGGPYCTYPNFRDDCADCSTTIAQEYFKATGATITGSSHAQALLGVSAGADWKRWEPGDILVYLGGEHTGVYVGNGEAVHAMNEADGVTKSRVDSDYWRTNFVDARRLTWKDGAPDRPKGIDAGGAAVGDVTPQSAFRELGNTDRHTFRETLSRSIDPPRHPSPLAAEADAIYDVLAPKGLTRLAAAMAWIERSNETNDADLQYYGRDLHNAWAVKNANGSWARYPTYAAAAQEWASRILGPSYADLTTLADFVGRYAPWSDGNNPDDYGRKVAAQVNALPRQIIITPTPHPDPTPTPHPAPVDPWRPYPFPPMVRLICTKPYDGAGFDRVRPRGPRIVGSCNHITDGRGSIESYSAFFSTGGERATDALVDTVIGRDGRIGLLNDWRDTQSGGTRAGWANGTSNDLEADGIAFYRRYPLINDVLVSKEHEGRAGEPLTDAQLAASIELSTAVAQSVKCPWDTYPYHPGFGGVNIEQMHCWFAPKACPAEPFIGTSYPRLIAAVQDKLTAWQGGHIPDEPVPPREPVWYTRFGFTLEEITTFFGTVTRHNQDGTTDEFGFDPKGALSLLWLHRCDLTGVFPEAERIWFADAQFVDGTEMYASWEGGWTAYLPLLDSRASWRWLDEVPA